MTRSQEDWKGAALIILSLAVGGTLIIIALGVAFFGAHLNESTGFAAAVLATIGAVAAILGVRNHKG